MKRILVIRGGAIGDFILTLPAIKLLRDNFLNAHIEILGYKRIIALAENRYYANATRSIDYAPLSRFFARDAELPSDLIEYFGSFDLIVSYLFDPDQIFAENLKRCGRAQLIAGSPKFDNREHASLQLARPLQQIGLKLQDSSACLYPNEEDRSAAADFLQGFVSPAIAIHPGSGSQKKNWPLENWIAFGDALLNANASRSGDFPVAELPGRRSGERRSLIVISGEADEERTTQLRSRWRDNPAVRFARNLSLPYLAAILQDALFIGHDSGVSHLAAAAGVRCILLFGPTDPLIWAPTNPNVKILRAPDGDLAKLAIDSVIAARWSSGV